jgi:hypothetical protein
VPLVEGRCYEPPPSSVVMARHIPAIHVFLAAML